MSDYINRVILKGRPSTKPQIRYLPSGDEVASFSLATKYGGDHVEWHSVVAYTAMAVRAATFDQGDLVYLEGRIQTRQFQTAEDKALNRKPRKVTEIVVDTINLVQKKGANDPDKQNEAKPEQQQESVKRPAQINEHFDTPDTPDQDSYIPSYL